jgi:hypothetical protein
MHLGPSAHRLMATEIYRGIDGVLLNPKEEESEPSVHTGPGSSNSANSDEVVSKTDAEPKRHNRRVFAA